MSGSNNHRVQAFSSKSKPLASMSRHDLGLPNIWQFLDPNSPWVLVKEGSLMGFFDFVPKHLRVGPWSKLAPTYVTIMVAKLIYWMPQQSSFHLSDEILSTHEQYAQFWVYNSVAFVWMASILGATLKKRGPGVLVTYTIQSWTMLTVRHALSALAPFLPTNHALLWVNELLRFPALATASVTFFFWNFIVAPAIYYNFGPDRRRDFLKFNFSFRLVQVHFFNIIFAIMNTVIASPREFRSVDLWCALAGVIGYALLYLLVLDRIGLHLYPVFSPRSLWSLLSWTALLGSYFIAFSFWNHVVASGKLTALFQ